MNYIFFTYDAIVEFASNRFFQSAEYENSIMLVNILRGQSIEWEHNKIAFQVSKNGCFFFTKKLDKRQGLIFDLNTFTGFSLNGADQIITVFQKTIKYAVRYFDNQPLTNCEKMLPNTLTTMVYPFPFVATKEVNKVFIDRNSSKQDRKEKNFLTVYGFGASEKVKVSFTNLNKAITELAEITYDEQTLNFPQDEKPHALSVVGFETFNLPIDAQLGIMEWKHYLTQKQLTFVQSPVTGPERLEGAAGTGKTLAMILRCINILMGKEMNGEECHIIFITHSMATKERIVDIFQSNWPDFEHHVEKDGSKPDTSIFITTLQEWSSNHLGTNSIADSEYLDRDACDSKVLQKMYIEQAFDTFMENYGDTYKRMCSSDLWHFFENTPKEILLDMLQYEIAILIKGRAEQNIDKYKKLNRPKYSIPAKNEADFSLLFEVYNYYQKSLEMVGQYDSDDIILSALGQIRTPIWNRRRKNEGYDICFIDETHLFNLNELSLFHFINKEEKGNHIVFAIDKAQAVGEWGITEQMLTEELGVDVKENEQYKFGTVFRSSPDIENLAFSILSSGATLFTNFENPLENSYFNFTKEDERRCEQPKYELVMDDSTMIKKAFDYADAYSKNMGCKKSSVLIVATTESLLAEMKRFTKEKNKPNEVLKSRSDSAAIKKATSKGGYVLGMIDYVGGLEFDAVIIIGVDEGRVPPSKNEREGAYHFMNYAWHNRMYVAVTRAKYAVYMLGVQSRGESPILESEIYNQVLEFKK